jgi:SWI/SNF-related matrix-associated actin-dependent regulator of chromatin subfamily D
LDITVETKKANLEEMLIHPSSKVKTMMTLHIFNVHYNQSNQFTLSREDVKVPAWKLVVQGKIRVSDKEQDKEEAMAISPYLKMTRFVKKIEIMFNKDQVDYPSLEWNRETYNKELGEKDGIEILREGNKELDLNILIQINYSPKQYKVRPELYSVIGIKQCTRLQAISALWEYIKINRLQDQQDRQVVNCNKELQAVNNRSKSSYRVIQG